MSKANKSKIIEESQLLLKFLKIALLFFRSAKADYYVQGASCSMTKQIN
jgi:hypothetical protein